jgi:hypothetical protein
MGTGKEVEGAPGVGAKLGAASGGSGGPGQHFTVARRRSGGEGTEEEKGCSQGGVLLL